MTDYEPEKSQAMRLLRFYELEDSVGEIFNKERGVIHGQKFWVWYDLLRENSWRNQYQMIPSIFC